MSKQPKSKHCVTCQSMIPVADYEQHMRLHDEQLDLFPDLPKQQVDRVRRPRRVAA